MSFIDKLIATSVPDIVTGLALTGVQSGINKMQTDYQNQYNEKMYNKYQSPQAIAEQLGKAGMSDAGIGAALSGTSGSGSMLSSAPMQPNNVSTNIDAISRAHEVASQSNVNDTTISLNKTQTILNHKQSKQFDLLANQIIANTELLRTNKNVAEQTLTHTIANMDAQKKYYEALEKNTIEQIKVYGSEVEFKKAQKEYYESLNQYQKILNYVEENTQNEKIALMSAAVWEKMQLLDLTKEETNKVIANTLLMYAQIQAIKDTEDVRLREAMWARYKTKWSIDNNMDYERYCDIYQHVMEAYGITADLAGDVLGVIAPFSGVPKTSKNGYHITYSK